MIAFTAKNKIVDESPIKGSLAKAGDYQYYWFSCNSSVANHNAMWEYVIAASVDQNGADVDLYVSAMDARYPTSEDYDFKSDNLGPDDIYIRSDDLFWNLTGYNKSFGIIFVVGVKAVTDNVDFTLVMLGPNKLATPILNLVTATQYTKTLYPGNNTHYFRWFNWGFRDFRVNLDVSKGTVQGYLNFVGEELFQNNGFLAMPWNQNNSRWSVSLNAT